MAIELGKAAVAAVAERATLWTQRLLLTRWAPKCGGAMRRKLEHCVQIPRVDPGRWLHLPDRAGGAAITEKLHARAEALDVAFAVNIASHGHHPPATARARRFERHVASARRKRRRNINWALAQLLKARIARATSARRSEQA